MKLIVASDLHAPYHDQGAIELLTQVMKWYKPDVFILNGDVFDFYAVSDYPRDPRRASRLVDELKVAKEVFSRLSSLAKETVFIFGNHEDRLDRYIANHAPALHGLVSVQSAIGLERCAQMIPYKDYYQLGKVIYTHDLDYSGPAVAQRAIRDAQHSVVVGHAHRISYTVEGDIHGRARLGMCLGWLGNPSKVDYKHRLKVAREWAHGFGIGETAGQLTHLEPVAIVQGQLRAAGKVFKL